MAAIASTETLGLSAAVSPLGRGPVRWIACTVCPDDAGFDLDHEAKAWSAKQDVAGWQPGLPSEERAKLIVVYGHRLLDIDALHAALPAGDVTDAKFGRADYRADIGTYSVPVHSPTLEKLFEKTSPHTEDKKQMYSQNGTKYEPHVLLAYVSRADYQRASTNTTPSIKDADRFVSVGFKLRDFTIFNRDGAMPQ